MDDCATLIANSASLAFEKTLDTTASDYVPLIDISSEAEQERHPELACFSLSYCVVKKDGAVYLTDKIKILGEFGIYVKVDSLFELTNLVLSCERSIQAPEYLPIESKPFSIKVKSDCS